jgi:salicylate hydroxylase
MGSSVSERPLSVAIIGGGIGGLFAANALRHHHIDVHVYEQADALTEVGAGVQLTPNSVRLLVRLGFGPQVDRVGAPFSPESQYFRRDRTPIAPIVTTDSAGWNAVMGMHRADMIEMLASALPEGVIHTGHHAVAFEQDDHGAEVTFANGPSCKADIIVGADGIHSLLSEHIGGGLEREFSGSIAYRGLVPIEQLPGWSNEPMMLWMGERKHFMVYPVRGGSLMNYVAFMPSDESIAESWTGKGDKPTLTREFGHWDPLLAQLIDQIDEVYGSGLYDRPPRQRWTNRRFTLLGDAAHPMLPHVGQGANQAMEDGAALAWLLARSTNDPKGALAAYERLRLPRTSEVQARARNQGRLYDADQLDLAARDEEIKALRTFRYWLYDYDVVAEAERLTATSTV